MPVNTPDWVKHAVFYQIFPDRFARTQQHTLPPAMMAQLEDWDSPPTPQGYKGGDLWGIVEHLDDIKDLGATALYLTPIFQSACNHRYHTHDYYQVDPLLGGNEALKDLLDAAHQKGLKVVLDGVFNHASRGFFFFNDILENGPHSPWLDWFNVTDWPVSAYDGKLPANYVGWVDNRALPQFNHKNPAVREYIMRVAEYWLRFGIDGWRLDVPNEVKVPGFWEEFRDRVKAINSDAYIVGEIWEDARQWLDGKQFDGVMNYLFTEAVLAFVVGDRILMEQVEIPPYTPYPALDAAGYNEKIQSLLSLYNWEIQLAQLNLLASHDTARLWTIAGGEPEGLEPNSEKFLEAQAFARSSVELATLLLLTFPGAPSIYYGDEVGLGGALDPDCRRSFPHPDQWDQDIRKCHRLLIQLRHQYPALRIGHYQTVLTDGSVYGFIRQLESQTLFVAVNVGDVAYQGSHSLSSFGHFDSAQPLYGPAKSTLSANHLSLMLPPRSGVVMELSVQ
ncbi:MAG: glycoside hydrolase family 13 protein [Cyanobacteria bacterium J06635_1]